MHTGFIISGIFQISWQDTTNVIKQKVNKFFKIIFVSRAVLFGFSFLKKMEETVLFLLCFWKKQPLPHPWCYATLIYYKLNM